MVQSFNIPFNWKIRVTKLWCFSSGLPNVGCIYLATE
uniref:Uncharacterized protein n=1 Tax=Rhizophora mucronata TaxID=61149 RepID=A0A2P2N6Z9_RHIMU